MVNKLVLVIFFILIGSNIWAQCTSPTAEAGARDYFTSNNTYRLCDGSAWVPFYTDGTLGACGANAGQMDWDSGQSAYKYCNGTNWTKIKIPSCTIGTGSMTIAQSVANGTYMDGPDTLRVSKDGSKAYVMTMFSGRFSVWNVANPSAMTLQGTLVHANLGDSNDFEIYGDYAFAVARTNQNFIVLNISNPAAPSYVTRIQASPVSEMQSIWGVGLSEDGNYAYTVSFASGASANKCWLHVIDISTPTAPSIVGELDLTTAGSVSEFCGDVAVRGTTAYVTFGNTGVTAVNVSNPAAPAFLSHMSNANLQYANQPIFSDDGTRLFTSSADPGNDRIGVTNISNPSSMVFVTSLLSAASFSYMPGMDKAGQYLFGASYTDDTVSAIDISNPAIPTLSGTLFASINLNGATDVNVYRQYAFACANQSNRITSINLGCIPAPNLGTCALASAISYFPTDRALAYCDGSYWRVMAR